MCPIPLSPTRWPSTSVALGHLSPIYNAIYLVFIYICIYASHHPFLTTSYPTMYTACLCISLSVMPLLRRPANDSGKGSDKTWAAQVRANKERTALRSQNAESATYLARTNCRWLPCFSSQNYKTDIKTSCIGKSSGSTMLCPSVHFDEKDAKKVPRLCSQ